MRVERTGMYVCTIEFHAEKRRKMKRMVGCFATAADIHILLNQ